MRNIQVESDARQPHLVEAAGLHGTVTRASRDLVEPEPEMIRPMHRFCCIDA
jgi:hypothetical protein